MQEVHARSARKKCVPEVYASENALLTVFSVFERTSEDFLEDGNALLEYTSADGGDSAGYCFDAPSPIDAR